MVDYLPVITFVVISTVIACLIIALSFVFSNRQFDPEKLSAYECGFDPFDDARGRFDVQFYLVCILFIIFDLEISFLFPWSLTFLENGLYSFCTMMLFLFILTVGFVYELCKGALNWQ